MSAPPVLLIVYRRPALTGRVFDAIASARPSRLFIAADGPAHDADRERCAEVRRIVSRVTWPCDVQADLSDVNLGCLARVSSALDWFFGACDAGIVLEDDCLPAPDFFRFCDVLLDRYRDDERIMQISGETYRRHPCAHSYSFSKYALPWGWATWRRAWRRFDLQMPTWPQFRDASRALAVYDSEDERSYWDETFEQVYRGRHATWDYPWMYACLSQGLTIHPAMNLVRNIGTADGATHMLGRNPFSDRPVGSLPDVVAHPPWVVRDRQADQDTFDDRFVGAILKRQRTWRHHAGRPFRWGRRLLGRAAR